MSFEVPGTDRRSHGDGVTWFSRRRSRTRRQQEKYLANVSGKGWRSTAGRNIISHREKTLGATSLGRRKGAFEEEILEEGLQAMV